MPVPTGPVWTCAHCQAQSRAPELPEGYVWVSNEGILPVLRRSLSGVEATSIHPSIAPKKVAGVRKSHAAHLPASEEILAVYDCTVFGSATDGFAVTARGLYVKNQFQPAHVIPWSDLDEHEVYGEGTAIKVGRATLETNLPKDDDGLHAWADVIATIARSARGPLEDEAPAAMSSAGAAAAVANAEAWGGSEVLVAATAGWGGTGASFVPGAGIPVDAARPDCERFPQAPYQSERSCSIVDVHPSGEIVLAAGGDLLELRYAQSGQRYLAVPAPATVLAARFSPDGNWLLVGCTDRRASLFEVRSGQHRGATPPMSDGCDEVAWLGRSSRFVAASQSGEVWIVDAASMTVVRTILGPDPSHAHLGGIAASPDGSRVYVSCGAKLGAFDVETGKILWRVEEALYDAGRLAISPRGDLLVMAGHAGVALIDAATGRIGIRYQLRCASGVSWPEGRRAAGLFSRLRGDDDDGDGEMTWSWAPRPRFSPAGDLVALQDHVGNLAFVDAATGALHPLPREAGRAWIEDVAFFPDGGHVLLGTSDNTIVVWRIRPMTGLLRCEAIGAVDAEVFARATYREHHPDDDLDDDDDDFDDD
jgi:hypothetical protein